MALVSPGQQITVTDESQYISNAIGTVPLLIMATAQDKTINGTTATGTTKANAGKLQIFGSQRDLTTAMGTPTFQQSNAGTPLHGDELNEYGLLTAYSALGVTNQVYAIRADVDLNEIKSTSVRPTSPVADGTYWLDLADTTWGIYEWNASTQGFSQQTPIVITETLDTVTTTQDTAVSTPTPLPSVGNPGSYAVVTTTTNNRVFYKAGPDIGIIDPYRNATYSTGLRNQWMLVGTTAWHMSAPIVVGSVTSPTIVTGGNLKINGTTVTINGTTAEAFAANVNSAAITGVYADVLNNQVALYSDSTSSGATAGDGAIKIETAYSGTGNLTLLTAVGLTTGTYNGVEIQYSDYANVPYWTTADATASPSGSLWFKNGATGGGSNFVIKKYNATTDIWSSLAAVGYNSDRYATAALDPTGGGLNIPVGTVYVRTDPRVSLTISYGGFKPRVRSVAGPVTVVGNVSNPTFVTGSTFNISPSLNAYSTTTYTITVVGTTVQDFVTSLLRANVPNVTAAVTANNAVSITHTLGGDISLIAGAGSSDIFTRAGLVAGVANLGASNSTAILVTGFVDLTYTYSTSQPVADPLDGTMWYYGDPTVIDVMINTGTAWSGYKNVTSDLRGYNLANTDPNGVIVSASSPLTQTDNTALVAGDLWLDTSDLINWPKLSRWNGTYWIAIDNTDQVSQSGILFADARWDPDGKTDVAAGNETTIKSLLTSDYLDLDAPNPQLYPRGMLLVNTRRSGYNIKKYVETYFTIDAFNIAQWSASTNYSLGAKVYYGAEIYVAIAGSLNQRPTVPSSGYWSLLTHSTWLTVSGLKPNGSPYAGAAAQRQVVIEAMKSALDTNVEIREDQFKFNLICTPGYPEVIANMVSLNNDRTNTAFIIGDTPMDLGVNAVNIINWSNNTNGDGLSTADPYLGVYYPAGISSDLMGNPVMVPPSHMALRTYLYNDNVAYPWFAPAGTRRGLVSNATDLGYLNRATGEFNRTGVNQALRDTLYANKINPITIIPGIGLVVWGQKTRDPNTESMDRVNVSRLVNYIRTLFSSAGNAFLFEPNDKITRDQFGAILRRALNDLVAKRGIYDYLVVCDTTNNTPDRIANNQLYADIAIEPMKDVEFIYIPIRLYNPGDIANLGGK
jgi:hypothetical protein